MKEKRVRVFLLRRGMVLALCTLALAAGIFYGTLYPTSRAAAASQRQLPIYSVECKNRLCAISFDAAWENEDTQLLIDKRDKDLDEDEIADYITDHFEGNSLIAAGDEDLVKIHFHTNEPWKILEYCNSVGEIYDIVVEDMIRQADGKQG